MAPPQGVALRVFRVSGGEDMQRDVHRHPHPSQHPAKRSIISPNSTESKIGLGMPLDYSESNV